MSPQGFDLSCNTALQSLEVQTTGGFQECNRHILREALRTITSPVFSEIVVVFNEEDVHWLPSGMIDVLREMHEIKNFRLVFYLGLTGVESVESTSLEGDDAGGSGEGFLQFSPLPTFGYFPCSVTGRSLHNVIS